MTISNNSGPRKYPLSNRRDDFEIEPNIEDNSVDKDNVITEDSIEKIQYTDNSGINFKRN